MEFKTITATKAHFVGSRGLTYVKLAGKQKTDMVPRGTKRYQPDS